MTIIVAGSREQGAWGRERGAWGRKHGAWGRERGVGSMELGAWVGHYFVVRVFLKFVIFLLNTTS
jgi:hypothetical protein